MSGTEPSREAVRIAGVVTAVVQAPMRWRTKVAGTMHDASAPGEVTLQVAGREVIAEIETGALCDTGPAEKCSWSEAVTRSGDRFPAQAAPAFTAVSLATTTLAVGAEVEIYGEVLARTFADDGGLRDAPSSSITHVRALLVASGAGAESRLASAIAQRFPPAARKVTSRRARRTAAPRPPDPRTAEPSCRQFRHEPAVVFNAIVWAGFALICLAISGISSDPRWLLLALGSAAAAVLFRPMPPVRPFRALEKRFSGARHPSDMAWFAIFFLYTVGLGIAWFQLPPAYVGYAGLLFVGVAAIGGIAGAATYARRAEMLRTPAWTGAVDVDAAIEGIVRDPTPLRIGNKAAAVARSTGYDEGIGSNPDKVVWQRFHDAGTFLIETRSGVVEVSPQHAVWCTTVVDRVYATQSGADYEIVELIPVGGRVLATGRIERGPSGGPVVLRSKGTRPAFVVATGPVGEPRDWLVRLARARLVTAAALAVIGGLLVWTLWLR